MGYGIKISFPRPSQWRHRSPGLYLSDLQQKRLLNVSCLGRCWLSSNVNRSVSTRQRFATIVVTIQFRPLMKGFNMLDYATLVSPKIGSTYCFFNFFLSFWKGTLCYWKFQQLQTGYVKTRFNGENILLISDVIESYEEIKLKGMLLFIETESIWFLRTECFFFFKVLEVRNFDPMFRKWIHTFSNITRCVMNNGHASDFFHLYSGFRQGCPLSCLLFVLAIEVLTQAIRNN